MQDNTQISTTCFDTDRWLKYFGLYVSTNRTQLILSSAVMLAVMLIVTTLIFPISLPQYAELTKITDDYPTYTLSAINLYSYALYYFVMFTGLVLSASFMFSSVHGKDKAFNTLVVPATQFEKWLTFFAIYIIGFWVVFAISMCLTEGYRLFVTAISGYDTTHAAQFLSPVSLLTNMHDDNPDLCAFIYSVAISFTLLLQACYALGSIYFRRFSFVVTSLVLGAMSFLVPMIITVSYMAFFGDNATEPRFEWIKDELNMSWVVSTAGTVIIAAMYMLGYRRYRKTEIINKW